MNITKITIRGVTLWAIACFGVSARGQDDAIWLAPPMRAFGFGSGNLSRERSRSGSGEGGQTNEVARRRGTMALYAGKFLQVPGESDPSNSLWRVVQSGALSVWIRNPDGRIIDTDVKRERGMVSVNCLPAGVVSNGVNWVGMHLEGGVRDGAGGEKERVHYYATGIARSVSRGANGGSPFTTQTPLPVTGFGDAERVVLEIVPLFTNTSSSSGQFSQMAPMARLGQTALEESRLRVLFHGQPLAGARVEILSNSGWRTQTQADEDGVFTVIPPARKTDGRERRSAGQCLYLVQHREALPGNFQGEGYSSVLHCASLLLSVQNPQTLGMETRSAPAGYQWLAVTIVGGMVLVAMLALFHQLRRRRETMVTFDQRRMTETPE